MSYSGKNTTPNTVQIYDGYKWVEYDGFSLSKDDFNVNSLWVDDGYFGYTRSNNVKTVISPITYGNSPIYVNEKIYYKFNFTFPLTFSINLPTSLVGRSIYGDNEILATTTAIITDGTDAYYAEFFSTWHAGGSLVNNNTMSTKVFGASQITLTSEKSGDNTTPILNINCTLTGNYEVRIEVNYRLVG